MTKPIHFMGKTPSQVLPSPGNEHVRNWGIKTSKNNSSTRGRARVVGFCRVCWTLLKSAFSLSIQAREKAGSVTISGEDWHFNCRVAGSLVSSQFPTGATGPALELLLKKLASKYLISHPARLTQREVNCGGRIRYVTWKLLTLPVW